MERKEKQGSTTKEKKKRKVCYCTATFRTVFWWNNSFCFSLTALTALICRQEECGYDPLAKGNVEEESNALNGSHHTVLKRDTTRTKASEQNSSSRGLSTSPFGCSSAGVFGMLRRSTAICKGVVVLLAIRGLLSQCRDQAQTHSATVLLLPAWNVLILVDGYLFPLESYTRMSNLNRRTQLQHHTRTQLNTKQDHQRERSHEL